MNDTYNSLLPNPHECRAGITCKPDLKQMLNDIVSDPDTIRRAAERGAKAQNEMLAQATAKLIHKDFGETLKKLSKK